MTDNFTIARQLASDPEDQQEVRDWNSAINMLSSISLPSISALRSKVASLVDRLNSAEDAEKVRVRKSIFGIIQAFNAVYKLKSQPTKEIETYYEKVAEAHNLTRANLSRLSINDFPYLDKKEKKKMIDYLDDFYKILNNSKSFKRNITNACREAGR